MGMQKNVTYVVIPNHLSKNLAKVSGGIVKPHFSRMDILLNRPAYQAYKNGYLIF